MEEKECPFCGKPILVQARKCKHCKQWLTEDSEDLNKGSNKRLYIMLAVALVVCVVIFVTNSKPTNSYWSEYAYTPSHGSDYQYSSSTWNFSYGDHMLTGDVNMDALHVASRIHFCLRSGKKIEAQQYAHEAYRYYEQVYPEKINRFSDKLIKHLDSLDKSMVHPLAE